MTSTTSTSSYYSTPIIWHIVSATVTWAVLPQLLYLISTIAGWPQKTKRQVHRRLMTALTILTLQAYAFAAVFAHRSAVPPQHTFFTSLLAACVLLQFAKGLLMPPLDAVESHHRKSWRALHNSAGLVVMSFAFFVIAHSCDVFKLTGPLARFVTLCVYFGAAAYALTVFALLVQRCIPKSRPVQTDSVQPTSKHLPVQIEQDEQYQSVPSEESPSDLLSV